jgi:uncharacterized delta-60 repeat protein
MRKTIYLLTLSIFLAHAGARELLASCGGTSAAPIATAAAAPASCTGSSFCWSWEFCGQFYVGATPGRFQAKESSTGVTLNGEISWLSSGLTQLTVKGIAGQGTGTRCTETGTENICATNFASDRVLNAVQVLGLGTIIQPILPSENQPIYALTAGTCDVNGDGVGDNEAPTAADDFTGNFLVSHWDPAGSNDVSSASQIAFGKFTWTTTGGPVYTLTASRLLNLPNLANLSGNPTVTLLGSPTGASCAAGQIPISFSPEWPGTDRKGTLYITAPFPQANNKPAFLYRTEGNHTFWGLPDVKIDSRALLATKYGGFTYWRDAQGAVTVKPIYVTFDTADAPSTAEEFDPSGGNVASPTFRSIYIPSTNITQDSVTFSGTDGAGNAAGGLNHNTMDGIVAGFISDQESPNKATMVHRVVCNTLVGIGVDRRNFIVCVAQRPGDAQVKSLTENIVLVNAMNAPGDYDRQVPFGKECSEADSGGVNRDLGDHWGFCPGAFPLRTQDQFTWNSSTEWFDNPTTPSPREANVSKWYDTSVMFENGECCVAGEYGGFAMTEFGAAGDHDASGGIVFHKQTGRIIQAGMYKPSTATTGGKASIVAYTQRVVGTDKSILELDTTFGDDAGGGLKTGYRAIDFTTGVNIDRFHAITVDANNKIVAAGVTVGTSTSNNQKWVVARFNSDGSYDTTFNTTGYAISATSQSGALAVTTTNFAATTDKGRIVVAGVGARYDDTRYPQALHTLEQGFVALYPSAGGAPAVYTNATKPSRFQGVMVDTAGKIVAVGFQGNGNTSLRKIVLGKFQLSTGTTLALDTGCSALTTWDVTPSSNGSEHAPSVIQGSDGAYWVGGLSSVGDPVIGRFKSTDCQLDTSYVKWTGESTAGVPTFDTAKAGWIDLPHAESSYEFTQLLNQPDGKIIVLAGNKKIGVNGKYVAMWKVYPGVYTTTATTQRWIRLEKILGSKSIWGVGAQAPTGSLVRQISSATSSLYFTFTGAVQDAMGRILIGGTRDEGSGAKKFGVIRLTQ